MRHLDRPRLLALAEGTPDPDGAAHLVRCERCRDAVAGLRATLEALAAGAVPEPSPLFWEQFSNRVRDAVAEQPAPVERRWPRLAVTAAVAATMIVAIGLGWSLTRESAGPVEPTAGVARSAVSGAEPPSATTGDADQAWTAVAATANRVTWDDAQHALTLRPGSTERLAQDLTDAERRELARLLAEELTPTGRGA